MFKGTKAAGEENFAAAEKESVYSASDGETRGRVVYAGVFGAGTAVYYTPTFSGLKEDIVLSEYTGKSEFAFVMETNGLVLKEDNGRLYLYDAKGNQAAALADIVCFNSEGKIGLGSMKVETVEEGKEYIVTVCADKEYLKSAAYPVYIDPTITPDITVSGSGSSKTIQDAPLYTNNTNQNGSNTLNMVGYVSSSIGTGRVLYRAPGLLANTTFSSLYKSQITNVSLCLKEVSGFTADGNVKIYYAGGGTWTESTVTYSSILYYGDEWDPLSTTTHIYYPTYTSVALDITVAAKEWKTNSTSADYGLILTHADASPTSYKTFAATEYATSGYKPYITVTYNDYWATVGTGTDDYKAIGRVIELNSTHTTGYYYFYVETAGSYFIQSCTANNVNNTFHSALTLYNSNNQAVTPSNTAETHEVKVKEGIDFYCTTNTYSSLSAGQYKIQLSKASGSTYYDCMVMVTPTSVTTEGIVDYSSIMKEFKIKRLVTEFDIDYYSEKHQTSDYYYNYNFNCMYYAMCGIPTVVEGFVPNDNVYYMWFNPDTKAGAEAIIEYSPYNYSEEAGVAPPLNGVIMYLNGTEVKHFAKIINGVVTAKLGPADFVEHESVDAYYSNSYGTTTYYYVQ